MPQLVEDTTQAKNAYHLLEPGISKLALARFGVPTEIQEKVIPLALEGKNLLCIAPTGFGKTESAFLPLLGKLVQSGGTQGIRFVYITPLKALNRDLLERLQYWCKLSGVSLAVRHGDTSSSERVKQRDNPPAVLVTTPETLNALLIGPLRDALRNVEWVVIDEVHELVDSKRGIQLSVALERLKERVKERKPDANVQIIGLSATVGSEQLVTKFVASDAQLVKSQLARKINLSIEFPTKQSAGPLDKLWSLDAFSGARLARILELIETHENTLVFVNTRSLAESLASLMFQSQELRKVIGVHHGSLARDARLAAEQEFKKKEGGLKAIICTSSLELGIDVGKVNLVIQYHSPRQAARLVQRVGRSGHSKGKTPKGVVIAVSGMDCVESAVLAKHALDGRLEPTGFEQNALDVLAHQIAGMTLDAGEGKTVDSKKAFEIIKRALPYATLSPQQFLLVCRQLKNQRLISISDDFSKLSTTRATKLYYYENVSTIADSHKYFVKDAANRKNVAMLDESFVAEYLQEGAVFITRGIPWRVLSVAEDEVVVEQSGDYSAAIPDWVGEEIPVSWQAAQDARTLLEQVGEGSLTDKDIEAKHCCTAEAAAKIIDFAKQQAKYFVPKAGRLYLEHQGGKTFVLHTFCGNKANEALSKALCSLLTEKTRASVYARTSAYAIAFDFAKPLEVHAFKNILADLQPHEVGKILLAALPATPMFRKSFADAARRFGLLQKGADVRGLNMKRFVEAQANTPVWHEAMQEILSEKLDAEGAGRLLENNKEIVLVAKDGFSPVAREFLEIKGFGELLAPMQATQQLLEAFKQSLLAKRTEFCCSYCLNSYSKANSEVEEKVKCPSCGSTQVTTADYADVIKKSAKGLELTSTERKQLEQAHRAESLISAYGRKAVIAFSTYGVGEETAARMLARLRDDELEFYNDLLEAQKNFVRTRKFWKI